MQKNNSYSDFDQQSVRDWEKVAQHELGNKNPWENLAKRKQGVTIQPYYTSSTSRAEKKLPLPSFTSCQNVPKVIVANEKNANEEALFHLNSGADGILFHIPTLVEINKLLQNIELPSCSVYFDVDQSAVLNELANFIESKSWEGKIYGALFQKNKHPHHRFVQWKNFHAFGTVVNENENVVDEIVDSLLTAVEIVEGNTNSNIPVEQIFRSIAFSITVDADFFLSISKIRALNNLWLLLLEAYQIDNHFPAFIHARSLPWINENFQPHGNMLKQTTAAMAAVVACCNALTVEPENHSNAMTSRIARNVPAMLKDESYMANVYDPLAGSFYLETLTNQLASEAWRKFQHQ
jgi:methylmalonyl-CoA mutase